MERKHMVKVRLMIQNFISFITNLWSSNICKTLSDTDGQLENGSSKLIARQHWILNEFICRFTWTWFFWALLFFLFCSFSNIFVLNLFRFLVNGVIHLETINLLYDFVSVKILKCKFTKFNKYSHFKASAIFLSNFSISSFSKFKAVFNPPHFCSISSLTDLAGVGELMVFFLLGDGFFCRNAGRGLALLSGETIVRQVGGLRSFTASSRSLSNLNVKTQYYPYSQMPPSRSSCSLYTKSQVLWAKVSTLHNYTNFYIMNTLDLGTGKLTLCKSKSCRSRSRDVKVTLSLTAAPPLSLSRGWGWWRHSRRW